MFNGKSPPSCGKHRMGGEIKFFLKSYRCSNRFIVEWAKLFGLIFWELTVERYRNAMIAGSKACEEAVNPEESSQLGSVE